MKSDFLNIPIEMLIHATKNRYEKKLLFFLKLKFIFPEGKFKKVNPEQIGKSKRTMSRNLSWLLENGWIKYNEKTNFYLIMSFDVLRIKYSWHSKSSMIVYESFLKDYAVFGAAAYGKLWKSLKFKSEKGRFASLQGNAFNNRPSPFIPVSTTLINSLLGINIRKASKIKKDAQKLGLLDVKSSYSSIYEYFKQHDFEEEILNRSFNGMIREPDQIKPNVLFRKRKSIAKNNN